MTKIHKIALALGISSFIIALAIGSMGLGIFGVVATIAGCDVREEDKVRK